MVNLGVEIDPLTRHVRPSFRTKPSAGVLEYPDSVLFLLTRSLSGHPAEARSSRIFGQPNTVNAVALLSLSVEH
jgi:hypothetical protein